MKEFIKVFGVVLLYFSISLSILYMTHDAKSDTYIDEEFHVPQAQKFCKGIFDEWDPKITTPPGLYAVSLFLLTPVSWLSGKENCSIFHLRLVNVIASAVNFLLLILIKRKLYNRKNNWLSILEACSLSSFPIVYFFSFLYYTDAVSTMFVLILYLMYLHDQNFMAAVAGLAATCIRQTNIIWVAYVAAIKGYSILCEALQNDKKPSAKRKKALKSPINVIFEGMLTPRAIFAVLKKTIWYIAVGGAFIGFIVWNGSIVLGDKDAHEATIHIPQVFYFAVCVAIFSPLHFLNFASRFMHIVMKQKTMTLSILICFLAIVHFNTLTHPYLLADNRHYTFYVWKRVFESYNWAKYALTPVYLYCLLCINESLKPKGPFARLAYFGCIVASLAPQCLLEPRYFIMPYIMFKLNLSVRSRASAIIDLFIAILVNAATIYIYTECPFDTKACVRFIW